MAFVITKRCVKCGACESECQNKAIIEEDKKFSIIRAVKKSKEHLNSHMGQLSLRDVK